ncbi:MAG: CBS domain-containing protein [Kofleriaceae bacterium]|nr:CBS domain-containing protein [Kofleriaceae bacterium]
MARRSRDGEVIFVSPADPLAVAYARMRASDVRSSRCSRTASWSASSTSPTCSWPRSATPPAARPPSSGRCGGHVTAGRDLPPTAGVHQLLPLFDRGMVGIVVDGDELLGLVTRVDLLNYLRRRAG